MVERLLGAQPDSLANHVKACQSLIERAATWAPSQRSAICRK